MSKLNEPNLDKIDQEITDILLEHLVLANDNGQPYIQYTDVAVDKIITLIATQIQEARIDERNNCRKDFPKSYVVGDKSGDYIILGIMYKKGKNRKFRVECNWCGAVMFRYSNKFKAKHIMCNCWRDEVKRETRLADRIGRRQTNDQL